MSLCKFPIFNFAFNVPLALPQIPIPDLDFSINLNLFCPLD